MEHTPMTLKELKSKLITSKSCAGGYIVSFEEFIHIYEFIHRMVIRNPRDISIALINLEAQDKTREHEIIEQGCQNLEQSILQSLRREDVAARCSDTQYVIILMHADHEQGSNVAERLMRTCKDINPQLPIEWSFSIYDMDINKEVEDELGTEYGQRFRDKCCIYNNQWISYCVEHHHIDVETYEEKGHTLINRMCLHCGYKWTVQHEDKQDQIRKVWSEGRWWNRPLE